MNPFVVDANVMNQFQSERLYGAGDAHAALETIFQNSFIVLDADGHCRQEWLDCAAGKHPLALEDWINDQLVERKIRLVRFSVPSMYKQLSGIGIPKKDHKWVRLAVSSKCSALVTDDIDLIEPTKKKSDSKTISKIKETCAGKAADYLKKNLNIKVICCFHVVEFSKQIAQAI